MLAFQQAGVPEIELREAGRVTAASLGHDAEVDPVIRQRTLGHANMAMTDHYTHPLEEAFRQGAEKVAGLVEGAGS